MANIIMCRFDKVIQRLGIKDAIFTILIANQKKSGDKKTRQALHWMAGNLYVLKKLSIICTNTTFLTVLFKCYCIKTKTTNLS